MNLSVPPRLHSAQNPIAFTVADDCGRTKASSLDTVQQADPMLCRRGLSAGDAGTLAILDVVRDASNPVGVVNDSVSVARSGRARDTGMSLPLVADDGANTVAAEPTSAEIDCLDVHSLGLALPNGRQLLSNVSFSAGFHVVDSPQPFSGPLAFDLRVRVESRRTVAHCLWLSDCQIADTAIVIVS